MSYRVTAPLVLARDKERKVHERYQDAGIDWLDEDQKRHFLESGLVEKVGSPAPAEPEGVGDPGAGPVGDEAPLRAAPKSDWVAYAVSKGADEAEANALNKPDLIDLYGE
jgi:hypothetical protein